MTEDVNRQVERESMLQNKYEKLSHTREQLETELQSKSEIPTITVTWYNPCYFGEKYFVNNVWKSFFSVMLALTVIKMLCFFILFSMWKGMHHFNCLFATLVYFTE